ncbi:MAG TPA: pirin family protein [Bacteroidales bacterium]|nr:pirin family protein [Bacteroidales bacterium]
MKVIPPPPFRMVGDGFRVHNFFPSDPDIGVEGMSPFFLLDYGSKYYFPPADRPRGVDVHPHKGFETVTIAYHGSVAHQDSAGNKGVINEGDVQWMTAASGILHKEYHEENFTRKGGLFQMVQLWVNLPARFKTIPPRYQAIRKEDIVRHKLPDNISEIGIIAGEYSAESGPASTFTPISLFDVRLMAGITTEFRFPENYNTGLLVIEGRIKINFETEVDENNFIKLDNNGEYFDIEAIKDSIVLIMSGEPINEPIVARGPFLLNSEEEIREAYDDFRNGKFGYLE